MDDMVGKLGAVDWHCAAGLDAEDGLSGVAGEVCAGADEALNFSMNFM